MEVSFCFGDFYVILETCCHPLLFRDGFLDSCVSTRFGLSDARVSFHLNRPVGVGVRRTEKAGEGRKMVLEGGGSEDGKVR